MILSRRQFLLGVAAGTAGLILPRFFERALAFLENHGEPLIEAPPDPVDVLYAMTDCELQLCLGVPEESWPYMTYREVFERYGDGDLRRYLEDWELTPDRLDDEAPDWAYFSSWLRRDSTSGRAVALLEGLDIGPELGQGKVVGGLELYEGSQYPGGGDCYHYEARDELSLSLLQHRLNQLGANIEVQLF